MEDQGGLFMKKVFVEYWFIALLVVFNPIFASGQRSNLYADIGTAPGLSLTYNYKVLKHLGLGIGAQGYYFTPTISNNREFVPAVFGDLHLNFLMRKKHFFYYFLDLGINFYKANDDHSNYNALFDYVTQDNGFYEGVGLGYFRCVTKRGGGWYMSLKSILNLYKLNEYDFAAQQYSVGEHVRGTVAICAGFKF